jgi:alpha-galactosidase
MMRLCALIATVLTLALAAPAQALDDGIARTPPMGWNTWQVFRCSPTEDIVRRHADAFVQLGLRDVGYRYINLDDCWMALERDANDRLTHHPERFPSGIPALSRYVRDRGLRFGIYTSAGPRTCQHPYPASYGHYELDFRTFAEWKVDYVKVDWCEPPPGPPHPKAQEWYARIHRAFLKAGRKMLHTVSIPGTHRPWLWAPKMGHSWRIAADATGGWDQVLHQVDVDAPLWRYAGPGQWNDPDFLLVGGGTLTPVQERSHMSLWSMLAAPLLIGADVTKMSQESLAILKNEDVIAVDQDKLGRQGRRVKQKGGVETWIKPLSGGEFAVLLFNRSGPERTLAIRPSSLPGVRPAQRYKLRELWTGARTTVGRGELAKVTLPPDGVAMWRMVRRGSVKR